jgi:hypothetical protein
VSDLAELNREVGELKATVSALHGELAKVRTEVTELVAILNQGKGAKWAFVLGYTLFSMFGGALAYFGIKLTAQ